MMNNKLKKNSLSIEIFKYLILFSLVILAFLWFFQVVFLNSYYRSVKLREIRQVANTIVKKQNSDNLSTIIDNITYDKGVCVEITDDFMSMLESSSIISRGCIVDFKHNYTYKSDFIMSGKNRATYEIENRVFKNNTLIYAVKLNNDMYAFINTSIDPMNSTTSILKNQLVYVTILVFILSFLIAFFISKRISKPIIKINSDAKKMANGNFDIAFTNNANIQEINELVETLNYTRGELKKTEEYRRDLMANVSHDLKTPLTMIKAYAEMARDLNRKQEEKREENLNVIIDEVDRLTLLVNDILDLSKMQCEIDTLKYETFDLIELINNILKKYNFLITSEKYEFEFIHTSKEIIITADKKKLEQVIYNLINNAINYSGDDNLVKINVLESNNIRVEIIDHGKGIKEKDLARIWDKYYKNEKKHKRNLIGTGLGLSIVKNILEAHNYKYGVLSKENIGSTFYFEIPKKSHKL